MSIVVSARRQWLLLKPIIESNPAKAHTLKRFIAIFFKKLDDQDFTQSAK